MTLRHVVEEGRAGATIVKIAEREKVELIVIGSPRAIERSVESCWAALAITSPHTQRAASVFVRPTELRGAARKIRAVYCYEETDIALAGLQHLAKISWVAEADTRAICVGCQQYYQGSDAESDAKAIARVGRQIHDAAPNIDAELILHDHVGEAIVQYAEKNAMDVVVVAESTPWCALANLVGKRFPVRAEAFTLQRLDHPSPVKS